LLVIANIKNVFDGQTLTPNICLLKSSRGLNGSMAQWLNGSMAQWLNSMTGFNRRIDT
jgi:hypothetical protein